MKIPLKVPAVIRTRGTASSVAHAWYNTLLLMMPTVQMDLNDKNTLSPPTKKLVHYHPLAVLTKLFYTWRPYKIFKCILQEKCGISRRYVCKG